MTGRSDVWQQQWRDDDSAQIADAQRRQAEALERQADALERQLQSPESKLSGRKESAQLSGAAQWISDEIARMQAAGAIPSHIMKSQLADILAKQMEAAHKQGTAPRAIGDRHIENNLRQWGLWPLSPKK